MVGEMFFAWTVIWAHELLESRGFSGSVQELAYFGTVCSALDWKINKSIFSDTREWWFVSWWGWGRVVCFYPSPRDSDSVSDWRLSSAGNFLFPPWALWTSIRYDQSGVYIGLRDDTRWQCLCVTYGRPKEEGVEKRERGAMNCAHWIRYVNIVTCDAQHSSVREREREWTGSF